jgi:hypothetical protein
MGLPSSTRMTTRSHAAKDHALSPLRPIPHPAPIFSLPDPFFYDRAFHRRRVRLALSQLLPHSRAVTSGSNRLRSPPRRAIERRRPRPPPAASPCVGIQSTSAPSPQDPVAVDIRSFSLLSPTYIWYQMLADAAVHCLPPCAVASLASICKPPPHSPPSACVGLRTATSLRPHAQQFVHLSTFF